MRKFWWVVALGLFAAAYMAKHARAEEPAYGFDCSFQHGGVLEDCDHMARAHPDASEHRAIFTSGSVMVLRSGHCVHPEALFRFHGAYYPRGPGYGDPSVLGSEHMRGALRRYPALVRYLDSTGIWMSGGGPTLDMTGEQLGQFGVPVCGR